MPTQSLGLRQNCGTSTTAHPTALSSSAGGGERCQEVRRDSAVKLVDVLAGASPASADCPVGTVVISGDGAGDQAVGSPDVNVLEGWTQVWSAPTGGQAKQQVVAQANRSQAPKSTSSPGSECEGNGNAETFIPCRRPVFPVKYWVRTTGKQVARTTATVVRVSPPGRCHTVTLGRPRQRRAAHRKRGGLMRYELPIYGIYLW